MGRVNASGCCAGPLGNLTLSNPSPSELPPCDYSFRQFFELLGITNVLRLLTFLLLEHQVLLKSSGQREGGEWRPYIDGECLCEPMAGWPVQSQGDEGGCTVGF